MGAYPGDYGILCDLKNTLITNYLQCVFSKFMQSKYGNTALIEACLLGYVEIARALLEHRASVDKQNYVSIRSKA